MLMRTFAVEWQRLNRQGEHLPLTAITVEECADALYRRFGAEGK